MDATEWTSRYCDELGVPAPSDAEVTVLLELAGVAAHASERVAAPVACWLAATAGVTPAAALEAARGVTAD